MDFILNGAGHGDVATALLQNNMDPGVLRPYVGGDGRSYVDLTRNGKRQALVCNTPATLRKDEWIHLDTAIVKVAKERLRAVADLKAAGLTYSVPNGMGTTVLQSENQSDINAATISMDGLREGDADRPEFDLVGLPLPIIHKDFSYSLRQLMTSRQSGSPLDTTHAELAARRCAETAESLLLGTYGTYAFGGYNIYGYRNFPSRMTATLTLPTDAGWTPSLLVQEILGMKQDSMDAFHYGPWFLYNSPAWDQYLDDDYSQAKGDNTLRERIAKISGIDGPRTLDYLPNYEFLLVQKSTDVVRLVMGMDFRSLQWETKGGLQVHFKIMGILVPQLRTDQNDKTGVVHGTAA
jgi:uncharacterized linocin/CFP29 family protein